MIYKEQFQREYWLYTVYATDGVFLSKPIPSDASVARREGFVMRLYVDDDPVSDSESRR